MLSNLSEWSMIEVVGNFLGRNETGRVSKPLGTNDRTIGKHDMLLTRRTSIDVVLPTLPGKVNLAHLYSHFPIVLPLASLILVEIPFDMMT